MGIKADVKDELVTISIDGSFDVSAYETFKDICQKNLTDTNRFIIDMQKTSYMDSSALGMLLLLREKTAGDKRRITLVNVGGNVQSILEIAQFQKLFVIK